MALEPTSHCDSRTPITGDAQSRVSVSLGSQSWADAESDHKMIPTSPWGHESIGYPSKKARFIRQKATWNRSACKGPCCSSPSILPTQRRLNQTSTMRPDELCSLREDANEVQWQEVRFVNEDLLEPQQLILVIIRRLDYPKHLLDYGAREVASSSQLQSTGFGCSLKHDQRIGRDRRSGDFRIGEVGFESDRVVTTRGLLTKSIQAVEFERRPGRFDAIQPSTNLGILQESCRNPNATI